MDERKKYEREMEKKDTERKSAPTLEEIKAFFKADRYAVLTGIEIDSVQEGTAVCSMEIQDLHLNAGNVVQGGAIFTLADFAFAAASNSGGFLTVSLNNAISYLQPPKGKRMIARAEPVSTGKKIAVYHVTVTDELGTQVAVMTVNGYVKNVPIHFDALEK